ncbi:hypothetical protein EDC65_0463 [Stella humosa]|uniref:Uncharacterized protein n=1 Tax=Stella humosa TaxID=94 RepID=A0A3N1MDT3_9PROT|nr:hypothetical protein [Stella humosa]ROQ01285.1 hypothetical protein EDC65_0463 [Stella humosa]BBK31659.1 hypothetical protein STHU_22930 [Stella humosa]
MDGNELELLETPFSPRAEIEAQYRDYIARQGLPAAMGFALALPEGWAVETIRVAKGPGPASPILPLARCRPVADDALGRQESADVVVWAVFLPREMHGRDWLRGWLDRQGYDTIAMRDLPSANGIMGDALATRELDGELRLHRMLTVKDGDILYLLDGRAPLGPDSDAAALQEIFLMAALRFRLLAPSGRPFAEGFDWTVLAGQGRVRFLASELWIDRTGGGSGPGTARILDNLQGEMVAGTLIAVLGQPGGDAEAITGITLDRLATLGFEISPEAELVAEDPTPERTLAVHRRAVSQDGAPLLVLSASASIGGLPVSLVLLSATEEAAFEAWAINMRAFEIAVHSLGAAP